MVFEKNVLAQGPKDSTVGDFWQMVYESGSSVIVMLTCNVENGSIKKASHLLQMGLCANSMQVC